MTAVSVWKLNCSPTNKVFKMIKSCTRFTVNPMLLYKMSWNKFMSFRNTFLKDINHRVNTSSVWCYCIGSMSTGLSTSLPQAKVNTLELNGPTEQCCITNLLTSYPHKNKIWYWCDSRNYFVHDVFRDAFTAKHFCTIILQHFEWYFHLNKVWWKPVHPWFKPIALHYGTYRLLSTLFYHWI